MTTEAASAIPAREPALLGQTVVVLGGSAGIGLETARRARGEGADVFLTGRNPERLAQAARDVGARGSAAFDANDAAAVKRFFDDLPGPIDHVLVAAYTSTFYGPMLEHPSEDVGRAVSERVVQVLRAPRVRLTDREQEVLRLLDTGASNPQIAKALFVTEATVKTHLVHIFAKLGVDSRSRAVAVARERGLL